MDDDFPGAEGLRRIPTALASSSLPPSDQQDLLVSLVREIYSLTSNEPDYPPISVRRTMFTSGAVRLLAFDVLPRVRGTEAEEWIWALLQDATCLRDNEDPSEYESIDLAVEHGLLIPIVEELERSDRARRRPVLEHLFSMLTTMCLSSEKHCDAFVSARLIPLCLAIATQDDVAVEISTCALGVLKNLSLAESSHKPLVEAGAVEFAAKSLEVLVTYSNSEELKLGLCAASLLCRLSRGDPRTSAGRALLEADGVWTALVARLRWLLRAVLQTLPSGTVIGSAWNPANIVLDLLLLLQLEAASERSDGWFIRSEPLSNALPQVLEAIERRGLPMATGKSAVSSSSSTSKWGNSRLVRYGMEFVRELVMCESVGEENEGRRQRFQLAVVRSVDKLSLVLEKTRVCDVVVDVQTYQITLGLIEVVSTILEQAEDKARIAKGLLQMNMATVD